MSEKRHHLLFHRNSWESGVYTKKLRQLPNLIVPMFTEVEEELHRAVIIVPLLDPYTAQHVYREYRPTRTYTGSIYGLMVAIENASQHRKTTKIQKQLAELTVHAISEQMPFILEGQLTNEVGRGITGLERR